MATKPKYKSDAFEAIHSAASALHRVGAIGKVRECAGQRATSVVISIDGKVVGCARDRIEEQPA
jgi:DNA-binding transcriptional regulator YiaG